MCYRYSGRLTARARRLRRSLLVAPTQGGGSHMYHRKRREFITPLRGTAVAWVLVTGASHAQTDFPNRPIHMVVPYPAGGIVDVATRIVTDKLSEIWQQPIVVEAKPAAGGNLPWDEGSRAKPD